ncbi:MAG: S1 RNA-binding domain-containing protein [Lentisphaerae bacterium]|nr:S1 RNA-binding domain-containing protein [Lentisphaerota bacterium]
MEQFNENDFGAMFEAKERQKVQIRTGEKVSGKVIMVGKDTVFVDLGARADGVIDKQDFDDGKGGFTVAEGDIIEAYCMGWTDEGIKLQIKMKSDREGDADVEQAYNAKMPIEGKVTAERKGGYTVQVSQTEAFCPFSQIDMRGVRKEPVEYIGNTYLFRITEYAEEGRNVVLSRRLILEEEAQKSRAALQATLQEGDIVNGTIVKLMPFGVFVDLGGVEGMVHISEMSWNRIGSPEEIVQEGQEVRVKVLSLEWGDGGEKKERIALSIKQAQTNPWDLIPDSPEYAVGSKRTGKVTRISNFGVFIELEPGVDGLAHISQLGADHRVEHPSEIVSIGDQVEVTILGVEAERKRIALCIGEPKSDAKPAELTLEEEKEIISNAIAGQKIEGEVESQKPFGLFVKLPDGRTGLLHISQIPLPEDVGSALQVRALYRLYPLRSKIEVVIREIDGNRISLTLPETLEKEREMERETPVNVKDSADASFGTLDDVFSKLKL